MASDLQGPAGGGGRRRLAFVLAALGVLVPFALALGFTSGSAGSGHSGSRPAAGLPTRPAIAGIGGSWKLVLADDFSAGSLDSSLWHTCYPWGCTIPTNPENEWYAVPNVTTGAGGLVLTARPQATHGRSYTSGMVQSDGSFDFRYGVVEVRAKLPPGAGTWPAIWMVPENESWPPEIDVMEYWGGQPGEVRVSLHYARTDQIDDQLVGAPDLTSRYHVFAVDWEPGSISWYLDGRLVYRVARSISQLMYPIINLAVADPPTPAPSSFPAQLHVSWIRVFSRAGVGTAVCNAPSCVVG